MKVKNNTVLLIFFVVIGSTRLIAQENYIVFDIEKDSLIIKHERSTFQIDRDFFNEEKFTIIDTVFPSELNIDSIVKYEKVLQKSRNNSYSFAKGKKHCKFILVYNTNTILPCVYLIEPIEDDKYKRTMFPLPSSIE